MMTFSARNEADSTAQTVIVLLAGINRSMLDIHRILSSKSAADKVTHTCDVRRYPWDGGGDTPEWFSFEVYVEAETKAGDLFCWSLDLSLQSEKWTLSRDISKQEKHGAGSISDFDSVKYESFSELRDGYAPLMSEFVQSAEAFTFPPQ
jgi:hypothetical protein